MTYIQPIFMKHPITPSQERANWSKTAVDVSQKMIGESGTTIAKGQVVRQNGATLALAQANTSAGAGPIGVAAEAMLTGHRGLFQTSGVLLVSTWTLTPGSLYYLSAKTPGLLVATPDVDTAGEYVIIVGRALSATELLVNIQQRVRF